MRRPLVPLAILACVILAGCAGPVGSLGNDPADGTVALDAVEYPDHTSAEGVEDAEALVTAMEQAVQDRGYVATYNTTATNISMSFRMAADPSTEQIHVRQVNRVESPNMSDGRTFETYTDGETVYLVRTGEDPSVVDMEIEPFHGIDSTLWKYIRDTELTVSHAIRDGERTLIVYNVTGYEHHDGTGTASGTFVVDEQGLIHEYDLSWNPGDGEATTTFQLSLETPDIEEPEWVAEAESGS